MDKYPNLFSPITIRGHVYRNRIITGPTMFAAGIFIPGFEEGIFSLLDARVLGRDQPGGLLECDGCRYRKEIMKYEV